MEIEIGKAVHEQAAAAKHSAKLNPAGFIPELVTQVLKCALKEKNQCENDQNSTGKPRSRMIS